MAFSVKIDGKHRTSLRKNVTYLKPEVLKLRDHVDLYTECKDDELEKPNVDHIVEIQMLDKAFASALQDDKAPVAARTRQAYKDVSTVIS